MEISWIDASANAGDEGSLSDPASERAFGGLMHCLDVGYLISKTRSEVKLATSVTPEDDTYRSSITIPTGWVRKITHLTRPDDLLHHPNDLPADPGPPDVLPSPRRGA